MTRTPAKAERKPRIRTPAERFLSRDCDEHQSEDRDKRVQDRAVGRRGVLQASQEGRLVNDNSEQREGDQRNEKAPVKPGAFPVLREDRYSEQYDCGNYDPEARPNQRGENSDNGFRGDIVNPEQDLNCDQSGGNFQVHPTTGAITGATAGGGHSIHFSPSAKAGRKAGVYTYSIKS